MEKELSPLAIIAILILFVFLGAQVFLNYQAATELPRLTHIKRAPNGHLYVPLGNELYEYGQNLIHHRTIGLDKLGVNSTSGEFAFFSNGELLIRQGEQELSFLENLERFFRHANRSPDTSDTNHNGLVRCDLESMSCVPFGEPPLNLNRTFHMTVDWQTDRVFIADSARHKVKLLSSEGVQLLQAEGGLKFPNKLRYIDGLLYVANTNRHEVTVYQVTDTGIIRDDKRSFRTDPVELKAGSYRWPASLLLINDEIWVINYDSGMANGKAVRFSSDGKLIGRVVLPDASDPFSMVLLGDVILISDYNNSRILRYSALGEQLDAMDLGPLAERISEYDGLREQYNFWMVIFIALFVLAFFIGIVVGIRQSLGNRKRIPQPSLAEQHLDLGSPSIIWLEVLPKFQQQIRIVIWLVGAVMAMAVFLGMPAFPSLPRQALLLMAVILPIVVMVFLAINRLAKQKIGVLGDTIILMASKDRYAAGSGKSIFYSHNQIGVASLILTIKTNQPVFSEDQLVEYVYPLLKNATSLSSEQMMWEGLRNKPWMTFFWTVAILVVLLAYLAMEYNWFEIAI